MEILGFEFDELRRMLAMKEEIEELAARHHSPAQILAVLKLRAAARRMGRLQIAKTSNDP
ncbi:hypothetical protein [Bradyrhizobium sp. 141]|uniref:hypothetical protein n=1 Tax=Bradyrhizobium sp. 141 TaxID=2782617 RepID=UPI001FF929CF|nr:hypothetical protein [Bradyrhizobium sp. 141]